MVLTPSTMVPLGAPAPDFTLPDAEGNEHKKADYEGSPLLVMFICNHCPYVKHIADTLAEVAYKIHHEHGVAVVGINANDAENYPEDSPENMHLETIERGYAFPYLFDETQEVAKAYHAACTPDFFLYDQEHKLFYRGQFDASRPGNGVPVTGKDLLAAVKALEGGEMPEQIPSLGCNIKWKE